MFSRSSFAPRSFSPRSWALTGADEQVVPPGAAVGSGRARYAETDDELRALVDAKWEAIEAAQRADARVPPDRAQREEARPEAGAAVAPSPVRDVDRPAAAATVALDVAAAAPLLPGAAQRAREARRRDDEEALLLLLADL